MSTISSMRLFRVLSEAGQRRLRDAARLSPIKSGEVLFQEGAPTDGRIFVLQEGEVRLARGARMVERLSEGALFGLRAHLTGEARSATATVEVGGSAWILTYTDVADLLESEPALAIALAQGFAAELPSRMAAVDEALRGGAADLVGPVEDSRPPLTCAPSQSVQSAAQSMEQRGVGSIVAIDSDHRPVGIVTDTDLRRRVVAAGINAAATMVSEVMSAPVATVREGRSAGAVLAEMTRRRVRHLCVTADGSDQTPLLGIISEHDVARRRGGSPVRLIGAARRAKDAAALRRIRDEVDAAMVDLVSADVEAAAHIASAMDDAIVERAMDLAAARVGASTVSWCWMTLGSGGRQERLARTDQDNALVFSDRATDEDVVRLVDMAHVVVDILDTVGLERCPGNIMAINPQCRGRLGEWKARFSAWMAKPEPQALLDAAIFFDLRPTAGRAQLATALRTHILEEVPRRRGFLPFLARAALNTAPPLGLFRGLVVERDGRFDLKARGLHALVGAARTLSLDVGAWGTSTLDRLRAVGAAEPGLSELCQAANRAFRFLLRYRAAEGLRRGDGGRYLELDRLDRFQRKALRDALTIVGDVQRALRTRYRLDFFG